MPMPPHPKSALAIIARTAVEDAALSDAARNRANEKKELARQRFEAVQDWERLKEADEMGALLREERGGFDVKGHQVITKQRDDARLTAASAAVDALDSKIALLNVAHGTPRLTATKIEHELSAYRGRKLVEVERPAILLQKGERNIDALVRLRGETLALLAERKDVENAPSTGAEVKSAADREIDKLADRLPRTLAMFHGAGIAWPQYEVHAAKARVPDALAVVAFLFREQLKKEIGKLIDFNAGAFPGAMSRQEQAERLVELEAEIDKAERLEAAAVEAVIAEGGTAHHRPGCSVLAVLSLRAE